MKQRFPTKLIVLIPVSIACGLLFATTSDYYLRQEITLPSLPRMNTAENNPTVETDHGMLISVSTSMVPPLSIRPDYPNSAARLQSGSRKRPGKRSLVSPHNQAAAKPLPDSVAPVEATATIDSAMTNSPSIHIEHRHQSDTVDPILMLAWHAYRAGDFEVASQRYSEVLEADLKNHFSPNHDALLGMAAIAQQRSQDTVAAKFYKQLLSVDPQDPDAHAGMSSLLGERGTTGVESNLKLLLEQHPETAALYFALGNHYAALLRWGEAQQAYFSSCGLEPDNAQFTFNLAVSLDHLGQFKLAAQYYRLALQLDHDVNASFDHAQTRLRMVELPTH